jgi:hypothetical protein
MDVIALSKSSWVVIFSEKTILALGGPNGYVMRMYHTVTNSGLLNNNWLCFQGNVVNVSCVWASMCSVFVFENIIANAFPDSAMMTE